MEKELKQQPSTCLRIVLFGPESTGKTTMAKALAAHFKTEWVPEYMREYLQQKWDATKTHCTKEDLIPIAVGQMRNENKALSKANKLLFCDTNLLELKVYSEYYYNGYCPEVIKKFALQNHYDLYLLTAIDVPWEKDDLRDRPEDRSTLFSIFENELIKNKLPYKLLTGSTATRLKDAINCIETVL